MLQLRPTFSESWYRVAALKVRLRPSAQISRQFHRGDRWYVVRDPAGNQYHRLSDPAYRFVALLDGSRTINEAWELVGGMMDDESPTQPEVIQILSQLYAANLIEADVTPDSSTLLKRHRQLSKRKFQQRLMNILFPRIPIWDPDRFLTRWMPVISKIMSGWGAVLWVIVVATAIFMVAPMGHELTQSARDSIAPNNWLALWAVFVFTKFIHEMGHASSCRRFGGECHEMGIMFLVFIPTPYVDASSAWGFPSRWQRMFVGAAGMTVELFFAALCAFVWVNTSHGNIVNQLAYNAMLIASVSTVLFNANPLLRYDGYYMLSDFLEIPNLQKKSTEYAMGLIKRHLFGVKLREPLPNAITRFWLFTYAIASTIYRVFIGIMIIVLVAFSVPVLGILMSMGGVVTWLLMPVFKTVRYLLLEPELHRKRGRAWTWSAVGAGLAILLGGVIPFPLHVIAEGVVEPVSRQYVYTRAAGFISELKVKDGQYVKKGDVLAVLRDDQLASEVAQSEASLEGAKISYRANLVKDPAQARSDALTVAAYERQLADRRERQDYLQVRAEVDGEVVGPMLEQFPGAFVAKGQQLMMIANGDRMVVRSLITQKEAELIPMNVEDGKTIARVRLVGDMRQIIPAIYVESVDAGSDKLPHPLLGFGGGGEIPNDPSDPHGEKSQDKQFELRAYLPQNASLTLETTGDTVPVLPGQRAYVRVDAGRKPIAWQVWRKFMQLIQSQSSSKWY